MKMNPVKKLYRRLPIIRELIQIRDSLFRLHEWKKNVEFAKLELALLTNTRYNDPQRLLKYGFQSNSQNLEDGMTWEIFRRIGTTNRIFAEIGVGDGYENNTAMFLSHGWTGFWFDGNPAMRETIRRRPELSDKTIKATTAFLNRENVARYFIESNIPKEFDLLSIDVDQNTYYLWEGLSEWKPRLVVVEYNAAIPANQDWKVRYDPEMTWDGTQNFGASLKAFENLGKSYGYSLVGCDIVGVNAFFVRDDLVDATKFCGPFCAENHYEPPRYAFGSCRRTHRISLLDRMPGPDAKLHSNI
jgi:hypothetical protein